MKHIAIYLRVSSRAQTTRSQEPDLAAYALLHEPVVWYRDNASGKSMNRPGWCHLETDMRAGKIDRIVIWRMDRLGRTVSKLSALFEELQRLRVNLVSLRDGLDLSTAAGRLMANVLASIAQFETELRGERVAAGQAAAKAAGKRWGGSLPGQRKRVTDAQIKSIAHLHYLETPVAQIAEAVRLSRPTVYAHLPKSRIE